MRRVISWEGEQKVRGMFLRVGAIQFPEKNSVLIAGPNNQFSNPPVGRASDFRREENGSITAEIELFNDLEVKDFGYTIYGKILESHVTGDWRDESFLWLIDGVELVSAFIDMNAVWKDVDVDG